MNVWHSEMAEWIVERRTGEYQPMVPTSEDGMLFSRALVYRLDTHNVPSPGSKPDQEWTPMILSQSVDCW